MRNAGSLILGWLCLLSTAVQPLEAGAPTAPSFAFPVAAASDSQATQRRSPTGAMVRSLLVPGWGQWYNGKKWKAALVVTTELSLAGQAIWQNQLLQRATDPATREYHLTNRNTANWLLALAVLLSMLDAYVDGHFSDFDESPDLAHAQRCWSEVGGLAPGAAHIRIAVRL
ncbi:MAG: DUF5683 domain-containing protein [candidate division KSB1 bacterium]|nr:DUF5683 domain-containing protein [candidate division KSB1 bacterium]MDZ7391571.1 DUF5683 domain-containing protein [candidate division KSB1 bacterium]